MKTFSRILKLKKEIASSVYKTMIVFFKIGIGGLKWQKMKEKALANKRRAL